MLGEDFIIVKLDDLHHGSSEVVQIPRTHLLAVVLREHHRVMHLPSVVHLIELLRRLDVKWFDHHLGASSLLIAAHLTPLLLLRVCNASHQRPLWA